MAGIPTAEAARANKRDPFSGVRRPMWTKARLPRTFTGSPFGNEIGYGSMKWRVTAGNCDRANSHAMRETWIKFKGGVNRRRAALLCTWRSTRTALWARLCESQAATIQAVDNGRRWHGLRSLWSK